MVRRGVFTPRAEEQEGARGVFKVVCPVIGGGDGCREVDELGPAGGPRGVAYRVEYFRVIGSDGCTGEHLEMCRRAVGCGDRACYGGYPCQGASLGALGQPPDVAA